MSADEAARYVESREMLGMRFGLDRMHAVLGALGDPQLAAAAVHVVGTNGKSSTSRFAAAALSATGRRVGTYLSPHVEHWRERIRIDGDAMGEREFAAAIGAVAEVASDLEPDDPVTQFEVLTAAAFVAFARAGVDAMVVEAGLGGRWDATNVLPGAVVAFTNVALEHTELLGDTVAAIAAEKLAVAPDGSDRLVIGRMDASAREDVRRLCAQRDLRAWWMDEDVTVRSDADGCVEVTTPTGAYTAVPCPVRGHFQRANLALAVAAAERRVDVRLPVESLRAALAGVAVPGRMEIIARGPTIMLDGAHNPAGMAALAGSLEPHVGRVAVASVLDDKDLERMLAPLAGRVSVLIATRSSHPRARAPRQIAAAAGTRGICAECVEDPLAAIGRAREVAGPAGEVIVCGSLYLLADVRRPAMARWGDGPGMLADESAGNVRI